MDIRPSYTLYINNLNDKVKKDELKRSLFELFSQFGKIMDIVALKTMKMRGQAFIVFTEISSANLAMRALNNFPFYDRPMRIQYSKSESEVISKLKNPFVDKTKKRPEEDEQNKLKKKKPKPINPVSVVAVHNTNGHAMESSTAYDINEEHTNNILFLSNLPEETTEVMLSMLFTQYAGFKEVRLVSGRSDIAFVEYETDVQAGHAKDTLNGFKMTPTHTMQVAFSKK